jgi:uncharacterized membrane protein YfcA
MDIVGYAASLFIGISLGLIGSGGSILTVPVLVYLFHVDAVSATAYSLFIVGISSIAGSVSYFNKGQIDRKIVFIFGIPSVVAVFLARAFIVPFIPAEIFRSEKFVLSKDVVLLLLFALMMTLASLSMIRKDKVAGGKVNEEKPFNLVTILLRGLATGTFTGLIGAGGGFLIIPVLVNSLKLPIKKAIGTSLAIIAINSLTGFFSSLFQTSFQWPLVLIITGLAIAGILTGSYIAAGIDGRKLKPAFGWFVMITGIYIIIRELFL